MGTQAAIKQSPALQPLDTLMAARLQQRAPAWLQTLREKARADLNGAGLPNKRRESWHYSSADLWLQQFDQQHGLAPISADRDAGSADDFNSANCLQFSHGVLLAQQITEADRDALTIVPLASLDEQKHADIIAWLSKQKPADSLASLATALAPESHVLIVSAEQTLSQPIVVSHFTSQAGAQVGQLVVWIEANAQATVLESFSGKADTQSLQIAHTQIHVARGAKLTYARLQRDQSGAQHLGVVESDVGRDAQLRMQVLRGGKESSVPNQRQRNGIYVRLQENGAEFIARGAFAAAGSQHIDYHFTIDHNADHGRCDVQMQGIAGDKSRGIVNGRIFIAKNTRANDGHFTTHNLLLSNDAEIDAKPELEIYADEVRCDHGATVGQLDEDQLLYMQTRGIDHAQAVALLTEGFLKAGLLDCGNTALNEYLQQQVLLSLGGVV
ncbi:MAG: SufD family Fe-S cluster assembly protein [Spongiibacteraceae bacterium]